MDTFNPVIESLLDTDFYKFTMWQPMLHSFPGNHAVYRFKCRNIPQYPLASLAGEVERQLDHLCSLVFTEQELSYLAARPFFKPDFIDFLRIFRFQRRYIRVDTQGDELLIEAAGPQIHVMGFEIYVLSIVNELYFRHLERLTPGETLQGRMGAARERLHDKLELICAAEERGELGSTSRNPLILFDFGTRRRYSKLWHEEVLRHLLVEVPQYFKGTSNVHFARKYNLTAIGTMAHEYLQTFQAVGVQLKSFQKAALENWVQEYRGDLGIALTDVVGMDAFLRDFDLYFAKLFDGLRHDSGDPFEWGNKAISHYQRLKINPSTKRLVFSDGLDFKKMLQIHHRFSETIPCYFGIGTNLTNDTGIKPLNIVMKLIECNGQPVAKLSDSPGKTLCGDETFLAYLRQIFDKAA